ncbi:3'-5' exonuclease family protein [Hymenobacter latericus]|uniref:exonuclease domain-containing protein n=1 Tax=Hymenobacter sp. YIM 151858-1 TaxID=2987688 RepID=UPI002225CFF3|nr:exonuclease domain-containing protein [Hymenobacter sp. YIM 151858-1]UYZ58601.1 exonuclease domain-containing protein [Hymenobacter sp. YIM 151858-1]
MRYVSLDLETTGGDPQRHQILELAAVIEDTKRLRPLPELPTFRRAVRHPEYVGTAGALALNARLLEELARKGPNAEVCTPDELVSQLQSFLLEHGFRPEESGRVVVTLAGKNVASFDLPFLKQLPGWGQLVRAEPATLDPAAFYLNWRKDTRLPTMSICKARARFDDHTVAHEAVADALDVIQLLRPFYELPVYKQVGEEPAEAPRAAEE